MGIPKLDIHPFFESIDRTQSALGQQLLYHNIRHLSPSQGDWQLLESGFQLYCFQEQIEEEELSFDYKLRPGALRKHNAISILEMAGYPLPIIAEARKLSQDLENQKIKIVGKKE